jgi:hypothetical protein
MAINNINNNAAVNVASISTEQSPVALASTFPKEALLSQNLQPLFQSINPGQAYPFTPLPLPFSKNDNLTQLTANPSLLISQLQNAGLAFGNPVTGTPTSGAPAGGGLESILQGLDVGGADASVAAHMKAAQDAYASGNMLQAQQEMLEAQKLQTFVSTLLNMITQMEMDAIKNSKVQ